MNINRLHFPPTRCHIGRHVTATATASSGRSSAPPTPARPILAIERMCAHSSGVIGFPLRLLAREVYDRVVAHQGDKSRSRLLTGEERIVPQGARNTILTTAESMPVSADRRPRRRRARLRLRRDRRGAIGDRPRARPRLHRPHAPRARPRGDADPRLGTRCKPLNPPIASGRRTSSAARAFRPCSYSPRGQARAACPRARAIVAFSGEQVYALAEMLRRFKGGAAVVMGSLSARPRATPRWRCSSAARSTIWSPPTPSAWASTWT